jgi:hypothetical protein
MASKDRPEQRAPNLTIAIFEKRGCLPKMGDVYEEIFDRPLNYQHLM